MLSKQVTLQRWTKTWTVCDQIFDIFMWPW